MSDRITLSLPYCFLDINKNMMTFKLQTFSKFQDLRNFYNLTSASVQVPHLTAQAHLQTKAGVNFLPVHTDNLYLWKTGKSIKVKSMLLVFTFR